MKRARDIRQVCNIVVSANKAQRVVFLHLIDDRKYAAIREVAINILINRHIVLSDKEKRYLRRKTGVLKHIALKHQNLAARRALLVKQNLFVKKICSIALRHLS